MPGRLFPDYTPQGRLSISHIEGLRAELDAFGVWQAYTPTWTASVTNPTLGNGTLVGRYVQIGDTVTAQVDLTLGSTTTIGSGIYYLSLPVNGTTTNPAPQGSGFLQQGGTQQMCLVGRNGTTTLNLRTVRTLNGNNHDVELVTDTFPWTWASGDRIIAQLTYEAA